MSEVMGITAKRKYTLEGGTDKFTAFPTHLGGGTVAMVLALGKRKAEECSYSTQFPVSDKFEDYKTNTHTHKHKCKHTKIYTNTNGKTHTHTNIHTCAHTHTEKHTYIHIQPHKTDPYIRISIGTQGSHIY